MTGFFLTYLQRRLHLSDADVPLPRHVGSRHRQLQVAAGQQLGRDVVQLQLGQLGELPGDPAEDVVVEVPGLVEVAVAA